MTTDYPAPRPASEQLVDLHVYLLPREEWSEKYSSTYVESIDKALSAGFVRVWPDLTVSGLRMLIENELGYDVIPRSYVFLKSVGSRMTQVKPKQELELKCKAFLPPTAWAPEIVVLEVPRDSMSVPVYQSFPGYSPRHDATQPINGIPTHFPQVANHDRIAQQDVRKLHVWFGPGIGQSPMMQQQQQGYKSDPLQSMLGNPGKSGRPDAYTNNTNEDSGIAEPTPDDEDTDYDRRKSEIDDQYYNQLHSNQRKNEQFQQEYEEKEQEKERQRQAEIQEREERRREEERVLIEAEKQREEERREHERKIEQKKQEDAKKQRQREMEKKWEEERRKEEEEMREEQKRKEEAERDRASAYDAIPLEDEDDDYDDTPIAMETNHAQDGRGRFLDDEQMKRRAEDELRDYEPQSTWQRDGGGEGGGEMSHHAHPGRRSRSREDTEMEIASQQAVQDGLKRVHLTPEVHRKAKIGKIRNSSITDEEDIYETDPEMSGLMEQLQLARQERMKKEKERESLIKKARDLQTKTYERRNRSLNESRPRSSSITPDQATHPRDYWKKRYYDEKKKTAPFEDQISRMRNQLELMHRKLLNHLEGKKKGVKVKGPPSKKNDHKINILKMQHELDELRRKVDNARMKLTSEIKLRNQAEAEVRGLKSEVTQRKINMTLIRNQKLAALKTGDKNLLSKTPIPALGQGHMSFSAKR